MKVAESVDISGEEEGLTFCLCKDHTVTGSRAGKGRYGSHEHTLDGFYFLSAIRIKETSVSEKQRGLNKCWGNKENHLGE